ncbi:GNAT family N-acetyltransferase [Nonomuraea sp. C10]|uniref:GNAT family N-acetyltransferase n=1 Tax=Nonomuraea sp. C10 TaxID=2600577 RepID=UPI0011CE2378|nr:GNAT family N-acetyltransferase [Nonomuraea sp. C10]TXK41221.1 GNAT family N-acetyltransferase [Nonomuraea sp. C10]
MLFRPTAAPDLGRLLDCAVDEPVSWAHPERLRSFLADGHYHHDRIWVAEQDGEILARAVWWGFPGAGPLALDCLHVHPSVTDRVALAAELLRHAHDAFGERPAYHVFLPVGWRGNDAVTAAVGWRQEACRRAGLTDELERLRYAWTPDRPLPEASGRLVFREEPDDETFVAAFAAASAGSLDHHTRQALLVKDAEAQAREDLADYLAMPGDRSWWRLAHTRSGELAGFALPSANASGPVVGYLGVLPEHRGHGYAGDLLAEITRSHAGRGADRVVADTDTGNVPMARAFERAGYELFAVRLVLSANPVNA